MKYEIKYKELTEYLKTLKDKDFQRNWNKNPEAPMKEGHSIDDIEYFKMDKSKITFDTVIDYGTPFLVDALGNDLSIIVQTKKKYKLPNGRAVRGRFDRTLINDCRKLYGTPLNGYWIIPDRFLTKVYTIITNVMDYKGRLYGKISGEYFDTSKTSDDYDELLELAKRSYKILKGVAYPQIDHLLGSLARVINKNK